MPIRSDKEILLSSSSLVTPSAELEAMERREEALKKFLRIQQFEEAIIGSYHIANMHLSGKKPH